jgi:multiple sugar transport system ATP-binding protein
MRGGIIQQLAAPQEIYNRPANLFVAGFIGSPSMNFLHGATVDGGQAFRLGDLTLSLGGYEGGAVGNRDKAILGLRPEHLRVQDHAEPGITIPAVVELDEPMGADSLVWLKAAGGQMSVRVPVEQRMTPGTSVHLKVDMAKASIFDAATESRV